MGSTPTSFRQSIWSDAHDRFDRVRHHDRASPLHSASRRSPMAAAAAARSRPSACTRSLAGAGLRLPASRPAGRHRHRRRRGGFRLNDEQALVATTDFFMPIVDDPVRLRPHRRHQRHLRRLRHGRHAGAGAGHPRHARSTCLPLASAADHGRRRRGLPRGGHPARRRALDRLAGTHLRPGGHRARPPGPVKRNDGARPGRRAGARQAARGRRPERGAEEGPAGRARLRGRCSASPPSSTPRQRPRGAGRGPCHDRRDRLRPARPPAGVCRGLRRRRRGGLRRRVPVLPAALGLARAGIGPGAIERNWASYSSEIDSTQRCPPGRSACSATPRPAAGCWSPVPPRPPSRSWRPSPPRDSARPRASVACGPAPRIPGSASADRRASVSPPARCAAAARCPRR